MAKLFKAPRTIAKLMRSDAFVRGVIGPIGCVAPETLVVTESGAVPIRDLGRPTRVLSWNEKTGRFQLSQASISFRKGIDYLYRVTTQRGEFDAAGHHRILCGDGTYQSVESLSRGLPIPICSSGPMHRQGEAWRLSFPGGAHRLIRTASDFLGRCAESARLCGRQILSVAGSDLSSFLEQVGVQRSILSVCSSCGARTGGLWGLSQEHTRHGQSCGPKRTGDSSSPRARLYLGGGDCSGTEASSRTEGKAQPLLRSRWKTLCRQRVLPPLGSSGSCSSSLSDGTIVGVKRLKFKQEYWDLQVLNTNNYVTVDGTIHHNSGKSAGCSVELGQWAASIPPCPDRVRRSRFAIVRNTYRQLEKTTAATWLQWFPEDKVGPFNKTKMTHRIRKKGFDAEFIFQALDKPSDIDNLLSLELTGAWINEAREIPLEVLQMLEGRVSRYPRHDDVPEYRSGIIMDTNPPDADHWWYYLAEELCPMLRGYEDITSYRDVLLDVRDKLVERDLGDIPGVELMSEKKAKDVWRVLLTKYEFFRQPGAFSEGAENLENLDKDYYTRQMIGKGKDWINVYVHANYGSVVTGKPVYPDYDDGFHYVERLTKPSKGLKILRGWDFGRTPAVVFSQLDQLGRWKVFDELCAKNTNIDDFGDYVKQYSRVEYPGFNYVDQCDSSGFFKGDKSESTAASILMSKGFDLEGGVQNPRIRIESVSKALRKGLISGQPAFQVGPKAQMIRRGFLGGYCYRRMQVSGMRFTDKPDKNEYSHPHDALQATGTMLFAVDLFDDNSDDGNETNYEPRHNTGRSEHTGY